MANLILGGYRKSTSGLRQRDRLDYWRDMICDEFVQLDCQKVGSGDFLGELRGGVGLSQLSFSEVISDPQFVVRSPRQIAKSTEADFLISFQVEQRGLIRQNGREAALAPGSFAMYDSTQPYSLAFEAPFHQFVLQMPKEVLSRHLVHPEQYTATAISARAGLGAVLTNFIFSLAKELKHVRTASDELADNLVEIIAMAFSSSMMLEQVGTHSVVRKSIKTRILHYIDTNLCDPQLCNARIAQAAGISIRYLHKLFEREAESIHALVLRKRLEKARGLIGDSAYAGHSIEQIAYATGFSSGAHFSRVFKKRFGLNPSDLR
ncbi:MAG: helix-turn-helix domain-containing protein [Gammaproteobacteria bacterium]|nr:helix-turn-helix domain-containing protein [Gammaproteobacteria bacterium]